MSIHKDKLLKSLSAQDILDAMPEVAYVFNEERELILWNKNCEKVLGYTADELYLKNVMEFVEESTVELNAKAFDNIFNGKTEQIIEQNLITKSGGKIPILDTANYALIGSEEYLIGLSIDITKLKETESKLQEVVEELQKLKLQLQAENVYLREEYKSHYDYDNIFGNSKSIFNQLIKLKK